MKTTLFLIFLALCFFGDSQTLIVTNTNDIGTGSLRDVINRSVNGGTIRFDRALLINGSDSIVLNSPLIIQKKLTIKGLYSNADTLYVSGKNQSGIFKINNVKRFTIDSLVLINGKTSGNGGAISAEMCDSLYVLNSKINHNSALGMGGGIYLDKSNSIYLNINNSFIVNNKSEGNGGGVYLNALSYITNTKCIVRILNSNIIGNTSAAQGGGVYCYSESSSKRNTLNDIQILGSNVDSNNGGGIFSNATGYFDSGYSDVAFIYAQSKVSLIKSSVSNNFFNGVGGGICSISNGHSNDRNNFSFISLDSSIIEGNNGINGGGIYSSGVNSNVNILNSFIINNTASSDGGGIYSAPDPLIGTNSLVKIIGSVIAENTSLGYGGGIFSARYYQPAHDNSDPTHSDISIINSKISKNKSTKSGGGVFSNACYSIVDVDNSTFNENTASGAAGIESYAATGSSTVSTINVNKSTFNNNIAIGGGAAMSSSAARSTININYSTIVKNSAGNGGSIINCNWTTSSNGYGSFINVLNSTIVKNVIIGNGFALYSAYQPIVAKSSIIGFNGNENQNFRSQYIPTIISNGYNIFSDTLIIGSTNLDHLGADSLLLNLQNLDYNGGQTKTMMPISPSIALDNGNPLDSSDAQNVRILGVREVGAAELCHETFSYPTITACDSFKWVNGITYYSSANSIIDTILNKAGCDSIITLNLTLYYSNSGIDVQIACDSFVWIDGITYYSSTDTAKFTINNHNGCDSLVTLNLTIVNNRIDKRIACDSLLWIDGNTYYNSNDTAKWILTSSLGCDSIITLNLIIYHTDFITDRIVACDSIVWIDGITYHSSNNFATHRYTNINGCDSIVRLNLTINNSIEVNQEVVACDSFVWINGLTYYSSTNAAKYILNTTSGCDSIINLKLIVNHSNSGIDRVSTCGSYKWKDGVTYTTNNNSSKYTLSNVKGCDSIVTLNLTVNSPSFGIDNIIACNSYTWIDGNKYIANTNSVTHTLLNKIGCDSIVTLHLTINNVDTSVSRVDAHTLKANAPSTAFFQWLDCNNNSAIFNEKNTFFNTHLNGLYAVQVWDNGCTGISDCYEISTAGLVLVNDVEMKLFPNPTNNLIEVYLNGFNVNNIEVTDIDGRLIENLNVDSNEFKINMDKFESGTYFFKFNGEKKSVISRIVKN